MRQIDVRDLVASDRDTYNAFFSSGAMRHPRTLRIAPEDIRAHPFETAPSAELVTMVAEGEAGWLGVGTLEREQGRAKRRHIAWIVRMFVSEPNLGVGRRILRELKQRALKMPGVEKLNLTVAADNAAAVHLYESEGFVVFSREPDAFRVEERPITELSMSCVLERHGAPIRDRGHAEGALR